MTPEQLDEIEKLAEAATPGPWVWRGPSSDDPADLWTADGKDAIVCVQTTNADVKFIRAMREHALPLVTAVREAVEQAIEFQHAADEQREAYEFWRAEAERLRDVVRRTNEFVEILMEGWQPEDSKLREMYELTQEGDR